MMLPKKQERIKTLELKSRRITKKIPRSKRKRNMSKLKIKRMEMHLHLQLVENIQTVIDKCN